MGGGYVLSKKQLPLETTALGALIVVVGVRLHEHDVFRLTYDPVNFGQQWHDDEVLTVCFEALDHSVGLTTTARVVVDVDDFCHSYSPLFRQEKTLRQLSRLKGIFSY
jgi:hypothetical protein